MKYSMCIVPEDNSDSQWASTHLRYRGVLPCRCFLSRSPLVIV